VSALPMSGAAWTRVQAAAAAHWAAPNVCNQDNKADVQALAGALAYARTGIPLYRTKVISAIQAAMATQVDGCFQAVLALGRQLGGWVLAADYVGYRDPAFIAWLTQLRTREIGGHGRWHQLRFTSGNSSNNWGIWSLASMIATDRFLGDQAALDRDWAIFKGYGDGTWTFQPTAGYLAGWNCGRYRAIEDLHCGSPDHNGVPAEDAARSGNTTNPDGGYVTEAMSGYTVQALLLSGAGYDAWGVNGQQIRRVADFQVRFGVFNYHPVGYYVPWVLNKVYGTSYPALAGNGGRMFGYTDWLFAP
jgi:hypothetical protein